MRRLRLFSTLKSAVLPLNTSKNKLKIYSSLGLGKGFRLTNGAKVSEAIAIIGGNYYKFNESDGSAKEAVKLLLKTIRPVPEIVVIGLGQNKLEKWDDLKEEFGCSAEVLESLTAASTFNTLIDDDRIVIGVFL